MSRLANVIRWEVTLQYRYKFYAVTGFVVFFWVCVLSLFPGISRTNSGLVVPAFFAINLNITTFYFIAGLVLLERGEGIHTALVTSPLRDFEYLISKVVTLTLLATLESIAIVVVVLGGGFQWTLLLAGSFQLAVIYSLIGFILVLPYDSINAFLMPSVVYVTLLLLPLVEHFGGLSRVFFYLHPVEPALVLMRGAYISSSWGELAYGVVGGLLWMGICFLVARRRFEEFLVRRVAV